MRGFLTVLLLLAAAVAAAWLSGRRAPVDEIEIARNETGAAIESRTIVVADGVALHVALAGPEDGPPVILIHGFPEFWFSWREQMAALAAAGYRVAAPDLRGYNRSDKPKGRDAYTLDAYAGDIIALMDAFGWADANVAGHDVGAAVLWTLAYRHPARIRKAVAFNVAPPAALADAYAAGAETVGWYRAFFRTPFLPELALRAGGYFALGRSMREGAAPGAFSAEDIDVYKAAWARDNAISTMLGFYRADGLTLEGERRGPDVPAYLVIASGDPFLPIEATAPAREYLGADNVAVWDGVSHWTLQEEPEKTAALMIAFFQD